MWHIIGFVVCFVLLFVFIAKYREIVADEQFAEQDEEEESPVTVTTNSNTGFKPRVSVLQSASSDTLLEMEDIKEQVRSFHYQLAEFKSATNKTQVDIAKQMARLEQRMSTFEQEYINKLQPTLLRVIDELEHIKGEEESHSGN